jgi:formate hydrogenlyase subunit 3/multisubunit Na+/H+ antiporter MnhD subunit
LVTGGALDQFSLHKEWLILVVSLAVICPCIALVRWINRDRRTAVRRWFAAASSLLLVHPLSILTVTTCDIFRYLMHMGFTPLRVSGLAFALLTYLILAWFMCWICGLKSWRRNGSAGPNRFDGHGGCNPPPL